MEDLNKKSGDNIIKSIYGILGIISPRSDSDMPHQFIPKKEKYKDTVGRCIKCSEPILYIEQKCSKCGASNENWKDEEKGICFNCHKHIEDGEKYCRFCGTKAGEGKFEPYQFLRNYECIYGPPPVCRIHTCENCGFEWSTYYMLDYEKYCPECGGFAPADEI